jgi:hypothetical protein
MEIDEIPTEEELIRALMTWMMGLSSYKPCYFVF